MKRIGGGGLKTSLYRYILFYMYMLSFPMISNVVKKKREVRSSFEIYFSMCKFQGNVRLKKVGWGAAPLPLLRAWIERQPIFRY